MCIHAHVCVWKYKYRPFKLTDKQLNSTCTSLTGSHSGLPLSVSRGGEGVVDVRESAVLHGEVDGDGDLQSQNTPLQLPPLLSGVGRD